MRIILLGAPGSGKGTQAEYISEKLSIPSVSTGAILREAVQNKTSIGIKAKEYMDSGSLVPDDIILGIVGEKINSDECKNGVIFDGFPRNVAQAEAFESICEMDCVLLFDVPDEVIKRRLTGRRACSDCGKTYHIDSNPPRTENICDACGGKLIQRSDDSEQTIAARLKVYHEETEPLIEFYKTRGKVKVIPGDLDVAQTAAAVADTLGYKI